MGPEFRNAREEDLGAIIRLLADDPLGATRERPSAAPAAVYEDAFRDVARFPGNEIIVAELAGELVGVLQLTVIPGLTRQGARRAQIEAVRIDRRHRGQGFGEAMMRHAIERARTRTVSTAGSAPSTATTASSSGSKEDPPMADRPTRRRFMGMAAAGAIAGAVRSPRPAAAATPIQHVVVILRENHSFDNYFG